MHSVLSDIVVLDLSRVLAGSYCTMMLGDLGATVIKIALMGSPIHLSETPARLYKAPPLLGEDNILLKEGRLFKHYEMQGGEES